MPQTAKYCEWCVRKLSPAHKSPKDQEFFQARLVTEATHPGGIEPRAEEGVCEKCGNKDIVIFYEN